MAQQENSLSSAVSNQITQLLVDWSKGRAAALDQLAPLVYAELRTMAARQLSRERSAETLQPTGLVHEAFLRLVGHKDTQWQSRAHFFSLASQLMRRILVDQARARLAVKRGAGLPNVSIEQLESTIEGGGESLLAAGVSTDASLDLLSIDAALTRLEALDDRQARIVELRFFGGLTVEETAQFLEISAATVKRDWVMAKAWLARELVGSRY
jgi:RNA polymerase sigma factor (TIGR02999 family)